MRTCIVNVETGLVVNIVDYDSVPKGEPPGYAGCVAVASDTALIEDRWNGETFVANRPRRPVRKSIIIARLHAAGKLAAASAALNADIYARERWYAPDRPAVYADDPEVRALLTAIGADPDVILAPE